MKLSFHIVNFKTCILIIVNIVFYQITILPGVIKLLTACLSDVKEIISNQCDLHFYECLAEYFAPLKLRDVV